MKSAVLKAKLGREEEMHALRHLDSQARLLEARTEAFETYAAAECAASPTLVRVWLGTGCTRRIACE